MARGVDHKDGVGLPVGTSGFTLQLVSGPKCGLRPCIRNAAAPPSECGSTKGKVQIKCQWGVGRGGFREPTFWYPHPSKGSHDC